MTDKFEQLKKKADDIRMTESERSLMRARIQETMEHFPIREPITATTPVKSPFSFMVLARSVALVLVGFIGGGGGLAFASEQALPGDILYTIKTDVTEEVVAVFKATPEAKIEWEEARIKRRAAELAELQIKGRLEEGRARIATDKIREARANVDTQVVRLSKDLSFDGVIFSPQPQLATDNAVTISATNMSLPTREDLDVIEPTLENPKEESEGLRPAKPVLVENISEQPAQRLPEDIRPNPAAVSGFAPEEAQISERDFGLEVLERMTLEVDKLEASKKIDDQTVSRLESLLEKANKLYENKQIKEFYETIREIKEILQKILKNS
jgi:hypothetical protein